MPSKQANDRPANNLPAQPVCMYAASNVSEKCRANKTTQYANRIRPPWVYMVQCGSGGVYKQVVSGVFNFPLLCLFFLLFVM